MLHAQNSVLAIRYSCTLTITTRMAYSFVHVKLILCMSIKTSKIEKGTPIQLRTIRPKVNLDLRSFCPYHMPQIYNDLNHLYRVVLN